MIFTLVCKIQGANVTPLISEMFCLKIGFNQGVLIEIVTVLYLMNGGTLNQEIIRVLDNQMEVIQNQQQQASQIIRVGLTTAGLLLTLISILIASDLTDEFVSELSIFDGEITPSIIFLISVLFVSIVFIAVLRIFAPALAVLNPSAERNTVYRFVMRQPNIELNDTSDETDQKTFDEGPISLRTGIDSDKAKELFGNESNSDKREITTYHIGCIEGNEKIIESNRRHLTQIYRTSAIVAFSLTVSVFYLLFGIFVLGNVI